ncbi:hypothetical protein IFM89_002839 [Coptis chinensis]|uniref:Cellulose synthase n=1 Tax=Coptis chinensis TaxID=261450 RepID=A0A835H2R9_9MAGN|nr:hypothetical protein IFM89_002839 [Coptis chinensis]
MHSRGWRSVYCMPARTAFRGSAPIDLSDRLRQVFQWAFGCIEILLSSHCPIWYGYGGQLKWLERVAYINTTISPLTSIPLLIYCTLPAVLLLTRKFIIPVVSNEASIWAILLFSSILSCVVLESRWSAVRIQEWWRNQQFWVIAGVSSHLFALFQGFIKVLMGLKISSSGTTMKYVNDDAGELYRFKLTSLLVLPTTLILINLWAMVAAMFLAASSGYWSWVLLFCRLFFAFCVVVHLHPFLKGLFGLKRRIPTVVVIWSLLVASLFALFWIRVSPFTTNFHGPDPKVCGIAC